MPNTHSKLAAAETTHGVLGDREHIEELEKHIFRLQESLRDLTKKYNDLSNYLQRGGPVEEAPEHQIQQLATQLEETEIRNEKLEDENQKLRKEKYFAVLSKAKLEKVLVEREKEIKELKSKLKAYHKKYLQHQTQKYKLCDKDCVVWSLLWICNEKLDECLCGRQLEKMITIHAERKYGITNRDLCCEYFMHILEECGIASKKFTKTYDAPGMNDNEYRDKQIDEVWQELFRVDAKDFVVMVLTEPYTVTERSRADRLGHCIVCDLKEKNEGLFECHDLQRDLWRTVTKKEQVKEYVKDDERITLYSVDTDYLREIINSYKNTLADIGCEQKMLPAPPVFDTEHVASAACAAERAACDAERAACDAERAACAAERAACAAERAACAAERVACAAKRAACDTERDACAACDAERAACVAERAACAAKRAACDSERKACDAERAACDADTAAYDAERDALGSESLEHL